jgi:hypothetical protein
MPSQAIDDQSQDSAARPYVAAAEAALTQLETIRASRKSIESHEADLIGAVRNLVHLLPEERRPAFLRRLNDSMNVAAPEPRSGTVYEFVVEALRRKPDETWTAPKVQKAVQEGPGVYVKLRAIENQLGYLARTGRLMRIAHGQYIVRDLGAGPTASAEPRRDGAAPIAEDEARDIMPDVKQITAPGRWRLWAWLRSRKNT